MTSAAQDSLHAIAQEDASGTQRAQRQGHGDPVIITRSGGPEHGRGTDVAQEERSRRSCRLTLGRTKPERG
jgi:hypothetical protein